MERPARNRHHAAGLVLAAIALTLATGCPVVSNLAAPGRVVQQKDPDQQREYQLYIPTRYTPAARWPLVVTCHGTRPYDTADSQFDEWKGLAEQKGFLLIAPELKGTVGDFVPPAAEQVRRQLDDEAAILSMVRTVSAGYTIDDSRIFLTGWSAGGYAVLFTGLRNPDVFRALSLRQPNFDPPFFELCVPFMDRYQQIQITFGSLDPLREGAIKCLDWLRAHEFEPVPLERPGTHKRDALPVYNFFADVVRHHPWVRVQMREDGSDPMRILLSVKTSFEPVKYLWDFGDGTPRMPVAAPDHRYAKPGLYSVRVGVWISDKVRQVRQVQVQVPRIRLGTTSTAPSS
ncbi:MAG: prolyl oligopeptidase family serine peptidase [Planctomycetes bacterium]|nr:prolyl oligopeptidase family serine peptidase [Planctomycetota bacterium]